MEKEIKLSEVNQGQKDKYHVFIYIWNLDLKMLI
jgi:hypothetical protein